MCKELSTAPGSSKFSINVNYYYHFSQNVFCLGNNATLTIFFNQNSLMEKLLCLSHIKPHFVTNKIPLIFKLKF